VVLVSLLLVRIGCSALLIAGPLAMIAKDRLGIVTDFVDTLPKAFIDAISNDGPGGETRWSRGQPPSPTPSGASPRKHTVTSLFHKAVEAGSDAAGSYAARDAPILRWPWDAPTEGRSHSDALVGCIVCSTTPSSSAARVSRSTCWRSRALNAAIVRTAS